MNSTESSPLLDGIIEHANEQAKKLMETCQDQIARLNSDYEQKAEAIRQAERRLLDQQLKDIQKREEAQLRNLQRKKALWQSDRIKIDTLAMVAKKMSAMVGTPEYDEVLVGWIAEAVVVLNRGKAVVSRSFKEHITETMLEIAIALVEKTIGKRIELTVSPEPISSQGVVVSSIDGKVVYDNRVVTRIERYKRDLNDVVEGDACKIG